MFGMTASRSGRRFIPQGGAGLGAPWTVPLVADFTTVNLSTDVLTDSPAGINYKAVATALALRGAYTSSPGGSFSIYMRVKHIFQLPINNNRYGGILLRNSTSGRFLTFGFYSTNTNPGSYQLRLSKWNSNFSYSSDSGTSYPGGATCLSFPPEWIRIDITPTAVTDFLFGDGYTWASTGISETLSTFINSSGSVDGIGFGGNHAAAGMYIVNSFSTFAPAPGGGGQT